MENIGRDYLGGAKFENVILKSHLPGYGGGFFWEQFGNAAGLTIKCAKKDGFMPFIRIQGLWAGSSHNYRGMERKASKIAVEVHKIASDFNKVQFYYSPFCENKDCPTAFLEDLHAKFGDKLTIVHSANKGTPLYGLRKVIINETHGDYRPKGANAYSYDGLSCINADSEKFKQGIEKLAYFMYWTSADNGRRNDSPTGVPAIPNRVHWTSVKLNESVFYQALNTRTEVTLKKGNLGKSHADPDTPPNPKEDNKLVILSNVKGKDCKLVFNGNVIAKADFAGISHEDGRSIYRFNKWGYELAKKSRSLEVIINDINLGKIDPGFRNNEYRDKPV